MRMREDPVTINPNMRMREDPVTITAARRPLPRCSSGARFDEIRVWSNSLRGELRNLLCNFCCRAGRDKRISLFKVADPG